MENAKKHKVVVINPEQKSVSTAYVSEENTLQEWYATIGNNCTLVTTATNIYDRRRAVDNTLLMDDEILLRPDDIKGAWKLPNGAVYFNTSIFSGCDEFGETCDCTIDPDALFQKITWLSQEEALVEAERIMNQPIQFINF